MATLVVETGNFATRAGDNEFSQRKNLLLTFFSEQHYDAVTLGALELTSGFEVWRTARDNGLPVVAANLYSGKRGKRTMFEPYRIFDRHGLVMGVVGLIPEQAMAACPDSLEGRVTSPFRMQKVMRKVRKKVDHLTIIGDFNPAESDSLARAYPEVDLILSPSAQSARPQNYGGVTVMGCGSKGYFGDYVQIDLTQADSLKYHNVRETLDTKIPAQAIYDQRIAESEIKPRK